MVFQTKAHSKRFPEFDDFMKFHFSPAPLFVLQVASVCLTSVGFGMSTPWGEKVDASDVLTEHPQPHLKRAAWLNLNGTWNQCVFPQAGEGLVGQSGFKGATGKAEFTWAPILVPFCPESSLSGVGRQVEPDQALWYQRKLEVKPGAGERTLLHFGAVDHEATVWVNGKELGKHIGGNTPFSFDITSALASDGNNTLTVRVHDATEGWQLRGKQALKPKGITYTRVSGIWQTVWMEQVPERHVENLDFETVVGKEDAGSTPSLLVKAKLAGPALAGEILRVAVS
ncbi:MAG: hypothetical protein EOP84_02105, partial [Verrucomicrobiaceae bacterium]